MSEQPGQSAIDPYQEAGLRPDAPHATLMAAVHGRERQYIIDKASSPITASDLRTLVYLPHEVALHEEAGRMVLNHGHESDVQYYGATRDARLALHTHPAGSENTFLSSNDVFASWRFDHASTTHMLVTKNGIVTFRAPQHQPHHPDRPLNNILLAFAAWGRDRGVSSVFLEGESDKRTIEERMTEVRMFCEATGMIIDETTWDDTEGVGRALEIINKTDTINEDQLAVTAARRIMEG